MNPFHGRSYRYYLGIDQSFSNTGLCLLDAIQGAVVSIASFSATANKPDYDNLGNFFTGLEIRVSQIVDDIKSFLNESKIDLKDLVVGVEYLASGDRSKDTDYYLSYLFFCILKYLESSGIYYIVVSPMSHRKAFFPVVRGAKSDLHKQYWESSFVGTGFSCSVKIDNDDQRDAFCLAYFTYLRFCIPIEEVVDFGFKKSKTIPEDRQRVYESIFSNICFETKKSKLCWVCPVYSKCKDKGRFRPPKTKREKSVFDSLRLSIAT